MNGLLMPMLINANGTSTNGTVAKNGFNLISMDDTGKYLFCLYQRRFRPCLPSFRFDWQTLREFPSESSTS